MRRLFYVAMTRAKKEVILTYSQTKNSKSIAPSKFLIEVQHIIRFQNRSVQEEVSN